MGESILMTHLIVIFFLLIGIFLEFFIVLVIIIHADRFIFESFAGEVVNGTRDDLETEQVRIEASFAELG